NNLRIKRPKKNVQIDYLRKSARNATIRKHIYDAVKLDTSAETTQRIIPEDRELLESG
ncbi:hypothetical protein PTT_08027, partial [Pyrenophora teres f. teres 0-1]